MALIFSVIFIRLFEQPLIEIDSKKGEIANESIVSWTFSS